MILLLLPNRFVRLLLVLCLLGLEGCATGPEQRDPLEPWNRKVSRFNDAVDSMVLKPAAIGYRNALPPTARTGISNFFGNLGDIWSAANSAMQLKAQHAAENFLRFGVNTAFGLGGVLDVASELGIERHRADFGLTLGRWGVPTGPYLVLPVLGPSTLRDTLALPADRWGDPLRAVNPVSLETGLYALRAVDLRSNLLRASSILDEVAFDKYSFTRDAYLQRRGASLNGNGSGFGRGIGNGDGSASDTRNGNASDNGYVPPVDDDVELQPAPGDTRQTVPPGQ